MTKKKGKDKKKKKNEPVSHLYCLGEESFCKIGYLAFPNIYRPEKCWRSEGNQAAVWRTPRCLDGARNHSGRSTESVGGIQTVK